MAQEKPTTIKTTSINCDGSDDQNGHPKVYLKTDHNGEIVCPYCSHHYKLAKGASATGH